MLWRDSRAARLILLYAIAMIAVYSLADEIQGVRQRAQVSFVFTWAQMHFLWRWIHTPASSAASARARSLPAPRLQAARATT
jgi:hypothetical protein